MSNYFPRGETARPEAVDQPHQDYRDSSGEEIKKNVESAIDNIEKANTFEDLLIAIKPFMSEKRIKYLADKVSKEQLDQEKIIDLIAETGLVEVKYFGFGQGSSLDNSVKGSLYELYRKLASKLNSLKENID